MSMEPELLKIFEEDLNNRYLFKIAQAKSKIKEDTIKLENYLEDIKVELKKQQYKEIIRRLRQASNTLEGVEIAIKNDIDRMIRNAVTNAYKRDVAEINQFRINTKREPKTPKYLSSIGTALIPSGGALFASLFFTTKNIWIAMGMLLILISIGVVLLIWSVLMIQKYDQEVKTIHNKLLMAPFEIRKR